MTSRIIFFLNSLFYFLVFLKFPFLLLFLFSVFCFQVNLFPVLCAFLTFSPAFQFPHFPFPPSSLIDFYFEQHYNIKVLLNDRIRSTVWLQLTLVVVKKKGPCKRSTSWKPQLEMQKTLKDISGSPSHSVSEQRLSSCECSTILCLQRQLHKWWLMTSYKIEGILDYGVHGFFCINRGETHPPTELGWGFLHQIVIETTWNWGKLSSCI